MKVKTNVIYLLTILVLSSCGGGNGEEKDRDVTNYITTLETQDAFEQTADTFAPAENLIFVLSIQNISATSRKLSFTTGQQFDLIIKDEQGNQLWQWSDDKAFTQAQSSLSIAAGDLFTVNIPWDQVIDNQGTTLSEATYTAEGYFLNHSIAIATFTIE